VVGSTVLFTKVSRPLAGSPEAPAKAASTARSARVMKRTTSGSCLWGIEKLTEIGSIWLITTNACVSLARTRFPSWTRRLLVRPLIGAAIEQNSRFSRALSTLAASERTEADSAWAAATTRS
jgi:hypothetical protein